jgi:hypothetical protein
MLALASLCNPCCNLAENMATVLKLWQKKPTLKIPTYLELKNEPFGDRPFDGGGLESGGGKFGAI